MTQIATIPSREDVRFVQRQAARSADSHTVRKIPLFKTAALEASDGIEKLLHAAALPELEQAAKDTRAWVSATHEDSLYPAAGLKGLLEWMKTLTELLYKTKEDAISGSNSDLATGLQNIT